MQSGLDKRLAGSYHQVLENLEIDYFNQYKIFYDYVFQNMENIKFENDEFFTTDSLINSQLKKKTENLEYSIVQMNDANKNMAQMRYYGLLD